MEQREREPIACLGLDEKNFRCGHAYATMLNDPHSGWVWDLVEGRKEKQARELLQGLDATQQAGVKAVPMDIWSAYRKAVQGVLPKADIVHDKFHLCAHLNKAVDTVRKAEHRQLASSGQQTLKGSNTFGRVTFPTCARTSLSASFTA